MLSFIEYLREMELRTDNPGGDWLKNQRKDAARKFRKYGRGAWGSVTAHTQGPIRIPVDHIKHLPGSNGEEKFRDDPTAVKSARLEREVGHPSRFTTKDHPVTIVVNHKGQPYIADGNHRTAYAARHGISHVHATVSYHAGGEDARGPLHPNKLKRIAREDDD